MLRSMLRRREVILGLGLFCIFLALWFFAWSWIARDVETRARAKLADAIEAGAEIRFATLEMDGFPFRWRITLDRVVIKPPVLPRGDQLNLARVEATFWPWSLRSASLWLPGLHRYERMRPGAITDRWEIVAASPEGHLSVAEGSMTATLDLDFEDVQIWHVDTPDAWRMARLRATATASDPPDTAAGDVIRLSVDAERISFRQPPPAYIPTPVTRVAIDLALRGAIGWRLPPGEAQAQWRDGGGTLDVPRVLFNSPPLVIAGDGTLALDSTDRPIGALTMRVQGYAEAIDAMIKAGQLTPRDAIGIRVALGLLSRADGTSGSRRAHIPVTLQDGRMTAGGFSIGRLPVMSFD